jgi:hypothetical protein
MSDMLGLLGKSRWLADGLVGWQKRLSGNAANGYWLVRTIGVFRHRARLIRINGRGSVLHSVLNAGNRSRYESTTG